MDTATEKLHRINSQIDAENVRLVDEEGNQVGIVSLDQALEFAEEAVLDLVEIAPNAEPPVCRVMDYGKYRYAASKKQHHAKRRQKQIIVKEVKFRPGTDIGDYDVKLGRLKKFLQAGNKTKVTLRFRGREMNHPELGRSMLSRVEQDLADIAVVEQEPVMEGRQMVMLLAPQKP
ncbi:MAG: translation initiation factor IF-3 [Gammaproteobacteria bacterium]|nr:translation initiation factor IF-3 [Gammaproteobacteria bacterium]